MIVFALLFVQTTVIGQSKAKAEKQFLKELNTILKNAKQHHWDYEGKMTIDSLFAISKTGILSMTVRYTNDESFIRARMAAPVDKIKNVLYDVYLILQFETPLVTIYNSNLGEEMLIETGISNLFHIAAPLKNGEQQEIKLQQALDNVLRYYKY